MTQDSKRIVSWLVVALVVIGGFLAVIFVNQGPGTVNILGTEISAEEWTKGNDEASITLVEYSDFQCPACKSREPLLEDIVNEFASHIKFVYRHFPLQSIHDNAHLAARASEAAGIQGNFWDMHDWLFANQDNWASMSESSAEQVFINFARDIGLDADQFESDLNSGAVRAAVDADYASGEQAGVGGTPSFFLNGTQINPGGYDEFRSIIRTAIEESSTPTN